MRTISIAVAAAALAAALAVARPVFAQTAAAPAPADHYDLPLERYPPPPEPPAPPEPPPEEDPPRFYDEEIPTEEESLIYVIDTSGSMSQGRDSYTDPEGNARVGNRLDRAKAEVIKSVNALGDNFTFNIVAYSTGIRVFRAARVPATARHKADAAAFTGGLRPSGVTCTGPGVATALADRDNKTIVLLSDGAPYCPAIDPRYPAHDFHLQMISSNNRQGAKINSFGVSAYGAFRVFMINVASQSGGIYRDVS